MLIYRTPSIAIHRHEKRLHRKYSLLKQSIKFIAPKTVGRGYGRGIDICGFMMPATSRGM